MVKRNKGTIKRNQQLPLKADLALSIGNGEVEQFNPVCSTLHSTENRSFGCDRRQPFTPATWPIGHLAPLCLRPAVPRF